MTQTQFKHDDPIEEKDENVDVIKIDNEEETLSYNGDIYEGEVASNCAFLIRIAISRFLKDEDSASRSKATTQFDRMVEQKKDEKEAKV